jgi:hypothetical protein
MQEHYKSETSHDEFLVILIQKAHKAILKVKTIDVATEHIILISSTIETLKKMDIKWIEILLNFAPIIPPNTISYKNKYNDNFICHIEDFEAFYLANINKIIHIDHVYHVQTKTNVDGWITVSNPKTEKKNKYEKLAQELQILVGDWNSM